MLKEERQQQILAILSTEGTVYSTELSKRLNVSEDTIRRDLNTLGAEGLLNKVHSGATRLAPTVSNFDYRKKIDADEKSKLAKLAFPIIRQNSVIIVDGSTTNLKFIENLPVNFTGTIITNSPHIALATSSKQNISTLILGGNFVKRAAVNLGETTIAELSTIYADYYLMGIHNLHHEIGATVHSQQESFTKLEMGHHAKIRIALVTKNKIGHCSHYVNCPIEKLDYLVTDSTSQAVLEPYRKKGIHVITPPDKKSLS